VATHELRVTLAFARERPALAAVVVVPGQAPRGSPPLSTRVVASTRPIHRSKGLGFGFSSKPNPEPQFQAAGWPIHPRKSHPLANTVNNIFVRFCWKKAGKIVHRNYKN
jgi:hypothetical protein